MAQLRLAIDALSPKVSVTTVAANDRLGCALARAWAAECHDRVVLADSSVPWSPMARAARALRKLGVPVDVAREVAESAPLLGAAVVPRTFMS